MESVVDIVLLGCYYECIVDYVVVVGFCVIYIVIGEGFVGEDWLSVY